ncbi:WYL domain-containing protein [Aliarcobacter butzleri]|uniref:helix-turn-helix transcriptional regulator n=1 Tax=Aliarcobacter butzleri TaxID=28197 RepID=UPI001EDAC5B3|nr:WYL domain-containing protein [Aliarcobacter butzleri]MCG3705309.1 WYL domain-containing protein [Aliarcobacter butzleri]
MKHDYDRTVTRLITILSKFSSNEVVNPKDLAQEFNVSVRTIQKDLKDKLMPNFPIYMYKKGEYRLTEGASITKSYLTNDEMIILSLALSKFKDVSDFDKTTDKLLKKLLRPNLSNPYFIKYEDVEDLDIDSHLIETIENAIEYSNIIEITTTIKTKIVEAYKMTNYGGIWYLFARDIQDKKIKTFMISKIKSVNITQQKHNFSKSSIEQILQKTHSPYYQDGNSYDVKVKVYKEIAHFFKQKDFLQSQEIEEELHDGSLIINFEISHDEDIDNIIKSWIPHIEILEPLRFKEKLKNELKEYLEKIS